MAMVDWAGLPREVLAEKFKNGDAPTALPRIRPFLINSLRVVFIVFYMIKTVESGTQELMGRI
jgi:hypothetical protein